MKLEKSIDNRCGQRADMAQLVYELKNGREISNEVKNLSAEDRGIIDAFVDELKHGVKKGDLQQIMRAWGLVKANVKNRENINRMAFLESGHGVNESKIDRVFFEKEIRRLFPEEKLIDYKGEKIFSTRKGGFGWAGDRVIKILLNPKKEKDGDRIVLKIDTGLFDDDFGLSSRGIIIWNSDLEDNETLIPWEYTNNLMFSPNATAYVDWFNSRIRPVFSKEQGSWMPTGVLRISDRMSKQDLVTVLVNNPEKYARALDELRKEMTSRTGVLRVGETPVARNPLKIGHFVGEISEEMVEKIEEMRKTRKQKSEKMEIDEAT